MLGTCGMWEDGWKAASAFALSLEPRTQPRFIPRVLALHEPRVSAADHPINWKSRADPCLSRASARVRARVFKSCANQRCTQPETTFPRDLSRLCLQREDNPKIAFSESRLSPFSVRSCLSKWLTRQELRELKGRESDSARLQNTGRRVQHSSREKQKLSGISKRGNAYLRRLFVRRR